MAQDPPTPKSSTTTPSKPSLWASLRAENAARKAAQTQRLSAAQTQQRTGYDSSGRPATQWRREHNERWGREQDADNRKFVAEVWDFCAVM